MTFRNDIQGLRAFSFIIVFIFHLNSAWLPGGFIGVDLFFVISGFLMTSIITTQVNEKRFNFTTFYINRLKRIVPAYYIFLLIATIVSSFTYLYTDFNYLRKSVFKSSLFISNQLFASGNSYFGANLSENPFLHTWSLSIEMQFYFILPILIYLFRKNIKIVLISLFIILLTYTTYKIYYLDQKSLMYFSLLARMPEFFIGGIFALIFKKGININNFTNNLLAFISLSVLILSSFIINETSMFPGIVALIPCIAGVLLLSLNNTIISDFFSKKPLVFIGELSYSLYLWHFLLMAIVRYKNDSYVLNLNEIIGITIFTFVFAFISYNLIEKIFKTFSTKKTLCILGIILLFINLYALSLNKIFKEKQIEGVYSKREFGVESHNKNFAQKFGDTTKNNKILLIGDSHAWSLKHFFDEIGKKKYFSFQTLTCDQYPALKGISRQDIEKNESNGMHFYETSLKLIDTTKKLIDENEIIILAIIGVDRPETEYNAIENLCSNLKTSQKLILINSYPTLQKNPLKINNGFIKNNTKKIGRENNLKTSKILHELSLKYPNVHIYNLDDEIINKDLGYINDTVAYYDKRHINKYGSKKLAEQHEKRIVEMLF